MPAVGNHGVVEFAAAADELYGVVPAEFTATRQRLAGELSREEARRFKSLRRPTPPAWAVNLLVRDGSVGPLLELGERMREAWSGGTDLAALEAERTTLVERLVHRARELTERAGRPLTDAATMEVDSTLRAAIADPTAAEAVREGRLERPLAHSGFAAFGTTAPTPTAPRAGGAQIRHMDGARSAEQAGRAKRARAADLRAERVRAAEHRAEQDRRALAERENALDAVRGRLSAAEERLAGLREQVKAAERERVALERAARAAERERARAARAAEESGRRARELAGSGPRRLDT
jgi:hypothetical protein